jgi:DNA-binding response OmpR family regulator
MSKTVMIVEDNELNMKLFHDLLEAHGYRSVATRNGMEALDLARKHRPDLILIKFSCRRSPASKWPNGSKKTPSSRPSRSSR